MIAALFESGKSRTVFPLKMFYMEQRDENLNRAAFSVPKKNFPGAVSRNRIKRQMREAYRYNKIPADTNNGKTFALLFLYISKDRESYASIERSMHALLKKIQK